MGGLRDGEDLGKGGTFRVTDRMGLLIITVLIRPVSTDLLLFQ